MDLVPDELLKLLSNFIVPQAFGNLICTKRSLSGLGQDDEVWRRLAIQHLWPFDESILQLLANGGIEAFASSNSNNVQAAGVADWRSIFKGCAAAEYILVVDIGCGYTKYGYPPCSGNAADPPCIMQLCSSPTNPADAPRRSQLPEALRRAQPELLRRACFSGAAALQRAVDRPTILLCEPFGLSSAEEVMEWREAFVRPQLPKGVQCKFAPQPLLGLLAHGVIADGIVVNLGHQEAVAVPCLGGRVCWESSCWEDSLSAANLTRLMLELLVGQNEAVDWELLTWCRDLKERYCVVAPEPLSESNFLGIAEILAAPPIEVRRGSLRVSLGLERWLVPEVLFRPGQGGLPRLVLEAAHRAAMNADEEQHHHCPKANSAIWERLMSAVVIVGGTAEFPGLRARLRKELLARLENRDFLTATGLRRPPKVAVLEPLPGLGTARTAVFHAGQLAAATFCSPSIVGVRQVPAAKRLSQSKTSVIPSPPPPPPSPTPSVAFSQPVFARRRPSTPEPRMSLERQNQARNHPVAPATARGSASAAARLLRE